MKKCIKTITFESKIFSPIHISDGKKISAMEYIKDIENKKIYFIKSDKLIDYIISQKGINDYKKIAEIFSMVPSNLNKNPFSLNEFFNKNLLNINKFISNKENILYSVPIEGDITHNIEIETCIKLYNYKPYIPGSTIKGFIRTAILYYYLKKEKEKNPSLFNKISNDIIDILKEENNINKKSFANIENYINNMIFVYGTDKNNLNKLKKKPDGQKDIFRFIAIPDISNDKFELIILMKKRKILKKSAIENNYNLSNNEIPVFCEVIKPKGDSFTIEIKINICQLQKKEIYNNFQEILQNIFSIKSINDPDFFGKIRNTIIKSIQVFSSDLLQFEERYIPDSEQLNAIKEFMNKNNEVFFINIGKYTNFFAKTITLLFKDKKEIYDKTIKSILILRNKKYLDSDNLDEIINIFPSTFNIIKHNNEEKFPGWIINRII